MVTVRGWLGSTACRDGPLASASAWPLEANMVFCVLLVVCLVRCIPPSPALIVLPVPNCVQAPPVCKVINVRIRPFCLRGQLVGRACYRADAFPAAADGTEQRLRLLKVSLAL